MAARSAVGARRNGRQPGRPTDCGPRRPPRPSSRECDAAVDRQRLVAVRSGRAARPSPRWIRGRCSAGSRALRQPGRAMGAMVTISLSVGSFRHTFFLDAIDGGPSHPLGLALRAHVRGRGLLARATPSRSGRRRLRRRPPRRRHRPPRRRPRRPPRPSPHRRSRVSAAAPAAPRCRRSSSGSARCTTTSAPSTATSTP